MERLIMRKQKAPKKITSRNWRSTKMSKTSPKESLLSSITHRNTAAETLRALGLSEKELLRQRLSEKEMEMEIELESDLDLGGGGRSKKKNS